MKLYNRKYYLNKQPSELYDSKAYTNAPIGNLCEKCAWIKQHFLWLLIFLLIIIAMFSVLSDLCNAKETRRQFVIVIDAGHGGEDPGMVAASVLEKNINLAIAQKLQARLEGKGITVVMTRSEDKSLAIEGARNKKVSDLKHRIDIINSSNADLLISIHQNCYSDASVCGAQVFYYGSSEKSEQFAKLLQKNIVSCVDENNQRQAKDGKDYYILRKSMCPGVIVECGFLSCPTECIKLQDDAYQNKLVDAMEQSIMQYFGK